MISKFRMRILIEVGKDHLSAGEVARRIGSAKSSVASAMNSMCREKPQIMHVSGANEGFPVQAPTTLHGWDEDGDDRFQLTAHGIALLPAKLKLVH